MKRHQYYLILLLLLPFGVFTQEQDATPDFRFMGFLQHHVSNGINRDDPWDFNVRRVRFGVRGNVNERVNFVVVAGALEPPNRTPQPVNAFIDVTFSHAFKLRAGQFFVPFGLEGQQSITRNPAIERSLVVRRLNTHRMFRDIGVQLSGRLGIFGYQLAVLNGQGANATERVDRKNVAGRVSISPRNNIEIGVSGQSGNYVPESTPGSYFDRNRFGVDIDYRLAGLHLRSEFIYRQDELPLNREQNWSGGYLLGDVKLHRDLSITGRFEYLETDIESSIHTMRSYLLGVNYILYENIRVSANYELRYDYLAPDERENLIVLQMQLAV